MTHAAHTTCHCGTMGLERVNSAQGPPGFKVVVGGGSGCPSRAWVPGGKRGAGDSIVVEGPPPMGVEWYFLVSLR